MQTKRLSFLLLFLSLFVVGTRASEITVNDGSYTNGQVPIYGYNADNYTASQFIIPADLLASMADQYVKKMTFYAAADKAWGNATFKVFLSEVENETFTTEGESLAYDWGNLSQVYEGALSIDGKMMVVSFDVPFKYEGGNLLVGFRQMTKGSYGSCSWSGIEKSGAGIYGYNPYFDEVSFQMTTFVPKVTFEYDATQGCLKPLDFTVSNVTQHSAHLTWTSDAGKWQMIYKNKTSGGEGSFTYEGEPSMDFNCPEEGATYTVRIRAVCDEDNKVYSEWTNPVEWTTKICAEEDMCAISYELGDEYGDGWTGNAIKVVDKEKGIVLDTWTLNTGKSGTGILEVCPGRELDFEWVADNYGYECSFTIYDVNGEIIYKHAAGQSLQETVFTSYLVDCTVSDCLTPVDFEATDITAHSATLSWTERGTATSWKVGYQGPNDSQIIYVETNENPFTLTGLEPDATYSAIVFPTCDASKQSSILEFKTLPACVAPEELAAEPDAKSAILSWTGYSDSYNVRYRVANLKGDFEDGTLGAWTAIRNGEGTNDTDWNVIKASDWSLNNVPMQAHSGEYLLMSQSYNYSNYKAYHVDNWLISPKAKLDGTLSFWVMDDGKYHDYYAVYVSTTTNDIESFTLLAEPGPATSQWTQVTVDLSNFNGQEGYIAIRHNDYDNDVLLVDDFTIINSGEEVGWTTLTTTEESIEITGLMPETTYEYEVQGVCEEANSKWTSGVFTTLEACPMPSNIAVEAESTTATVTWSGSSENYNVRYRIPATREQLFFEDFENGMDEWTTIDADGDGYNWGIMQNGGEDANGNPRGFDDKHAYSASYVNSGNSGFKLTPDNWLISPELDLKGTLSVWLRGQDPNWAGEHFAIYLSTTGKAVEDFTTVLIPETVAVGVLTEYTADLSEYEGQKGYIAIRHFNITDMFHLNVDNFALLGEEIAGTDWQTVTTEGATAELTGLKPGATYELQVQGVCDNVPTEWSNVVTFTTSLAIVLLDNDQEQPEGSKNPDILASVLNKNVNVTLQDRTFFKDGEWNTLCLPFSLDEEEIANSPLAGATIKVLTYADVTGNHVDMSFTTTDKIEAGNYYIIKWENGGEDIVSPSFNDVKIELAGDSSKDETDDSHFQVVGNFTTMIVDPVKDNHYSYYLGAGNKLRYSNNPVTLHTFRLFFVFFADEPVDPAAVVFNLNFDGENTEGIVEIDGTARKANANEGIYNIQGVKYNEKPQQKGVYIMNGSKVVVK